MQRLLGIVSRTQKQRSSYINGFKRYASNDPTSKGSPAEPSSTTVTNAPFGMDPTSIYGDYFEHYKPRDIEKCVLSVDVWDSKSIDRSFASLRRRYETVAIAFPGL